MDIKLFFEPLSEAIIAQEYSRDSFISSISLNKTGFIDYKNIDIAIIGLGEFRGSTCNKHSFEAADEIRKKLYQLTKGTGSYKIVDLGNLRSGPELGDTYDRISEVCNFFLQKDILPILIGGSHDLDIGQYKAYEEIDKLVNILNIDAYLDLSDKKHAESSHLHNIFMHEPNYLTNYTQIGHQSYFVHATDLEVLEKLNFSAVRLGSIREDFKEVEPIIRDADMLSFDISAIKRSFCPGAINGDVFGLTGEEACQITWYAGQNDRLSSAGFYGYDTALDDAQKSSASVLATMIWYFIDGFYHRKGEQIFRMNDFTNFTVTLEGNPSTIVFFKSKKSDKWWMEIPGPEGVGLYSRASIIPCSYSDYETATNGELPERWLSALTKGI